MPKQRNGSPSIKKADLAPFHLPIVDIYDRLNAMLETERKPHYQCRDYLHYQQPSSSSRSYHSHRSTSSRRTSSSSSSSRRSSSSLVTPSSRGKIVQWLYNSVDYLELQRECVAIAMSYVDRFMSINNHPKAKEARRDATVYQLIALSSFFLAAKQSDKMVIIDANMLVAVSHESYSAQEIIDMESTIVEVLDWRLCCPTALGIAYHGIALLSKVIRNKRRISSVVDFCRLQIELSVVDYATSVLTSPSTVALASIVNSMELLDFDSKEKRAFSKILMNCTGVDIRSNNSDIAQTRVDLHQVFDRQSDSVMSRGAKNKTKDHLSLNSVSSSSSPVDVEGFSEFNNSNSRRSTSGSTRKKPVNSRKQRRSPATCVDRTSSYERKVSLEP